MSSIRVSVRGQGSCLCVRARDTQTPTCTPIILDGLAVKCVMWGRSVYVCARDTNTNR